MKTPALLLLVVSMATAGCASHPTQRAGVRALKYHIVVSEGAWARIHGDRQVIEELFLPDHGVACNIEWSLDASLSTVPRHLRAFRAEPERMAQAMHVAEVVISPDLAAAIVEFASQQVELCHHVIDGGLLTEEPGAPPQ